MGGKHQKKKIGFIDYLQGIKELISIVWRADKKLTVILALNSIMRNITFPIRALIVKKIIDLIVVSNQSGFTSANQKAMVLWMIGFFIMFNANRIWWPLNAYAQTLALAKVSYEIKRRIMDHVRQASLEFFDHMESYNVLQNCLAETDSRRPIHVINNIFNFCTLVISFVVMFIPMVFFNPLLTAILIFSSVPGIWLERWFGKKTYQFETENAFSKRRMGYIFGLFINKQSAKEIRIFNTIQYLKNQYLRYYQKYIKKLLKINLRKFFYDIPMWAIMQTAILISYYFVIYSASNHIIALGQLSFFLSAIYSLNGSIKDMGDRFNNTVNSSLFMQNMFKLYKNPYVEDTDHKSVVPKTGKTIEFKQVSFKYPHSEDFVLKDINLCFEIPEHVAIVGLNGSGKTTLIKLLLRLYEVTEGEILYNGVNIREFDMKAWRKLFSVCFQDYFKYAFTASDNIGLGNLDQIHASLDISRAARLGGAHEIIEKLPLQYQTYLSKEFDEGGVELSGGQYNRIALARAFFGQGEFVILDEPTAALDAKAEYDIFKRFDELTKNRLGIMITHRLSSTVAADKIIVLEQGKVVEIGTHPQLMKTAGAYAALFEMQSKRYRTEMEAAI